MLLNISLDSGKKYDLSFENYEDRTKLCLFLFQPSFVFIE